MASKETADVGGRAALDWLLGRNIVIGIASMVLLALSGFATYRGMSDFILGVQETPIVEQSIGAEVLVFAIVIALTLLMWIALRETVKPQDRWKFIVTLPLYLFLALWSIGFGYGFWWSLIAGGEATRTGLQGQAEDVRDAAVEVAARLTAVQSRLDSVVRFSERQMTTEEASGGSCGVRSSPGRGPLWRARSGVRDSVDALSGEIQATWLSAVEADLQTLNTQLTSVGGAVTGATLQERQAAFERAAAEIRGSAREIAARSDALGDAYAQEMRQLAAALSIRPGQDGFSCYDPDLAARLLEAANDAAQEADVSLRPAEFSEGAAGVAAAVTRLWSGVGRGLQAGAGFETEPIDPRDAVGGRDLIALLAALGVDLGLLVLAILNPPKLDPPRRDAFERDVARVSLVNPTTIEELSRAFNVAIRDVPGMTLDVVRLHFIAHKGRAYLVAPNIYRCDEDNPEEIRRGIAMNQVAGVLDEYQLIEPLEPRRRREFWKADPRRISSEDLANLEASGVPQQEADRIKREIEDAWRVGGEAGLFGKARRAMQAAGWGHDATVNPEIWPLVSTAGLTPLLMVLEEASKRASAPVVAQLPGLPYAALPASDPAQQLPRDRPGGALPKPSSGDDA